LTSDDHVLLADHDGAVECAYHVSSVLGTRLADDLRFALYLAEFLEAIRSVNPPSRWKILVVDDHAQKLLTAVLKQFDILEENVTCESLL
jgi:hypothetical protein